MPPTARSRSAPTRREYEKLFENAQPPAARRQGERRVGHAGLRWPAAAPSGRRPHRQRLAAVGRLHRQLRQPVRPRRSASRATAATANLTGSPDYGARIVYVGDPGSGCSTTSTRSSTGVDRRRRPTGSVGLESGRNILIGCPNKLIDISLVAQHPPRWRPRAAVPGGCVQRVQHGHLQRPSDADPVTRPDRPDGAQSAVQRGRLAQRTRAAKPRNAGFGAANGRPDLRNFQAMVRFSSKELFMRTSDRQSGWDSIPPAFFLGWRADRRGDAS